MHRRLLRLSAAGLLVFSTPVFAPPIIVDETTCTLVDAIIAANSDAPEGGCPAGSGADIIELHSDVTLTEEYGSSGGLPGIFTDITIEGQGFIIERAVDAPPFRLLTVWGGPLPGDKLSLNNLTLRNGKSSNASAILSYGLLTLTNSTVTGNESSFSGSAIFVYDGLTTVDRSRISDNVGGGIAAGGGDEGSGRISMTNSMVSDNLGGIGVEAYYSGLVDVTNSTLSGNRVGAWVAGWTELRLTNSTISDNNAGTYVGGGCVDCNGGLLTLTNSTLSGNSIAVKIYYEQYYSIGGAKLQNTIIGHGNVDCVHEPDFWGDAINDLGGNFGSDGSCGAGFTTITGLDPQLAHNGGPTRTHRLSAVSNAIGASGDCGLETDQRGQPRDDACDAGSYEYQCEITVYPGTGGTEIYFRPLSGFDVVTGMLSHLRADGDFSAATCLGTFSGNPGIDDFPDPLPGDGRYYLARGHTACPGAGYGVSSLIPDPRSALAIGPCP